jgi:glycosyltransferase involved in cell wall biosynthesis
MLRVGVWPGIDEPALAPLAGQAELVRTVPRHRRPWLFWPLAIVKPLTDAVDRADSLLTVWPAPLLDAALAAWRARQRWPLLLPLALPLLWLAYAAGLILHAALRALLAPLHAYQAVATLLESHPSMLLSPEEQVLRAGCEVWLAGPGFPYPPGVRAVSRTDDPPARLWAAAIQKPGEPLIDTLRRAAASGPPADPLPGLLAEPASPGMPHVHLVLPAAYRGGTWESARALLQGLAEVNRSRRAMTLSLGVPEGQPLDGLDVPASELAVEHFLPRRIGPHQVPFSPGLVRASAWLALADRFEAPLLPARPYALMIHDVIHRFAPESYPIDFHQRLWPALLETARGAAAVVATTEATRRDLISAFGLPEGRAVLVPVACEPGRRFAGLAAIPPPLEGPFLLNPTNAAPHKGAEVMLAGFALLRRRHPGCPPLVLCGHDTERLSPEAQGPVTAYWARVRRLVQRLGLRPGVDVHFLGFVEDAGLLGLLRGASVVINAARHDNGTFALIEANHLGRPVASSRYPAAEELYSRFGVPVSYFDAGSPESLADAVEECLGRQAQPAPLHAELSQRRFAERVYDLLLRLARPRAALSA